MWCVSATNDAIQRMLKSLARRPVSPAAGVAHAFRMIASMLPSLSLNHAAFAPPAVTNATRALLAGHIVVLERDAARLQLSHLALDVVDLPERLACQRGASVGVG